MIHNLKKKIVFIGLLICFISTAFGQKISIPFSGDYPDPSIVLVGDTYYMTHTSHACYPGLLIWKSKDLKQWEPVCRALHEDIGVVWAPEIIYYKNKFYIYVPTSKGGNYVITADKAEGPWSSPIRLDITGIDPGHAVENGQRYLYVNGGRYVKITEDGLKATTKEARIYSGWKYPSDWAVECFCLESPKITSHDGYYFLVSAQGGTSGPSTSHMAVVARSKSILGPWENSPYNPLVHTFHPSDPWVSKGHATLFEDKKGDWHIIYHAYDRQNRQLGRSTLMESVRWTKDNWPVIKSDIQTDEKDYKMTTNTMLKSDDFSASQLSWQWCFWGLETMKEYQLKNGTLTLEGNSKKMHALTAIAPTADYEFSFKVEADPGVETGVVLLYDDDKYVGIGMKDDLVYTLSLGQKAWEEAPAENCKYMKVRVEKSTLCVSYSADGKNWKTLPQGFDVSGYQTNNMGGFFTLKPAVICKGDGKVVIDDFIFNPIK